MRVLLVAIAATAALLGVSSALATAPPVGPLPKGPMVAIVAKVGKTFLVKLPASRQELVWRVARPFDARVVREVGEGDSAGIVWIKFRAVAPGRTTIVFAQTRGETAHAYAARTFRVSVRR
jgi:hypothetical protein